MRHDDDLGYTDESDESIGPVGWSVIIVILAALLAGILKFLQR